MAIVASFIRAVLPWRLPQRLELGAGFDGEGSCPDGAGRRYESNEQDGQGCPG